MHNAHWRTPTSWPGEQQSQRYAEQRTMNKRMGYRPGSQSNQRGIGVSVVALMDGI